MADPRYLYAIAEAEAPSEPKGTLGRYQLFEVLGRGGMGVVYRARDPELSRDVALKVLIAAEHADETQLDRFLREARAAARLVHPNVVRVLDIQRHGDQPFFTMDLVRGPSLADLVDELGPRPIRESVRIVADVGRALHEAHRHDLLHRDVKPGNVLLTTDGTPRLTDFGLVSATEDVDSRITRTGQVLGTPAYMAPEQATSETDELTPAVDQYSLGAVLYELLAGRAPFEGTAMDVLMRLVTEPPMPVRALRPEVPRDLEVVVQRAMDMDPKRRYASVLDFVEDLERWRRGEPVHARPASLPYRLRLWAIRRRRLLLGVLVGVAMAFGLMVGVQRAVAYNLQQRDLAREHAADVRWDQAAARFDALRAEGAEGEAEAAFRAFVDEPLHWGTAALAHAWQHRAEALLTAGDIDGAVGSFGEAYVTATREADQVTALRGLARAFLAQWRFDALDIVVQSLGARGVDDPEVRAWRVRSALERDDVVGALALAPGDDPRRPLLEAFATARPLVESVGTRWVASDDRTMLDLDDKGRLRQIELGPGLTTRQELTLGAPLAPRILVASSDPLVVVNHDDSLDGEAVVFEVRDGEEGPTPTVRWPEARLGAAVDLPQGLLVGVGPYTRHLVRVDRATGALDHPAPEVDRAASDVMSLAVGDLDGDGDDEIVVGSGLWGAYDVRVYDGDWTPLGRRKVGVPQDIEVAGGRIFVTDTDQYPSRQLFPVDQPFGEPAGVVVMRLGDDGLVVEERLVSPVPHDGRASSLSGLMVGDLDGDGLDDVVVRSDDDVHGPNLLTWRQLPDGWSDVVVLGDVRVFAAADADGDGRTELLVDLHRDRTTGWVLGDGDAPIEPLPLATVPVSEVPAVDDPVVSRQWARAEDLVRMGLLEAGASAIESLAHAAADPAVAPLAYLRSGRLWEAAGEDERAAVRYQEAAKEPALRQEALDAATLALERTHGFEEAVALTVGRDTPTARSVRSRLEPLLADSGAFVVEKEGLLEELTLRDPRWGCAGMRPSRCCGPTCSPTTRPC